MLQSRVGNLVQNFFDRDRWKVPIHNQKRSIHANLLCKLHKQIFFGAVSVENQIEAIGKLEIPLRKLFFMKRVECLPFLFMFDRSSREKINEPFLIKRREL